MTLNSGLRWGNLPEDVRKAFRDNEAEKQPVELPAGFKLCKFTEYALVVPKNTRITPWWSPEFCFENDPGLQARIDLAKVIGVPATELARVVAAVTNEWNAMDHLLVAQLTLPVLGFWGQCAPQRRHMKDANEPAQARVRNLPGYAWQFYIPNLTAEHIMQLSFAAVPASRKAA